MLRAKGQCTVVMDVVECMHREQEAQGQGGLFVWLQEEDSFNWTY